MTTAQVVRTSVTVNNNSLIQDYVHPNDQTQPTFKNIFIMKNLTDFRKTVETSVDPRLPWFCAFADIYHKYEQIPSTCDLTSDSLYLEY